MPPDVEHDGLERPSYGGHRTKTLLTAQIFMESQFAEDKFAQGKVQSDPIAWRPWREWEFVALVLLVIVVYFTRMTDLPAAGEETRWATAAAEMLRSGDWIVLRQQGEVFPERPPLGSWTMALVGLLRGSVDEVAIRLPSAIALLVTTLLVYMYGRTFLTRLGALAAGAAFATAAQVLQIGRMGESEALFTLFVGGGLLVWHLCYRRGYPALVGWMAGYGLAALGALTKGPQAPVYFAAATGAFLLFRRDWRRLVSWQHLAGILAFLGIVAAWQVPYYLATDLQAVIATWCGLASDRFGVSRLAGHLVKYPLETIACMLPWSVLLVALAFRPIRQAARTAWPELQFLVVALAVTYPTVWLATGARGRYYMPLYPLIALLLGWLAERCAMGQVESWTVRARRMFIAGLSLPTLALAAAFAAAPFVPALHILVLPTWLAVLTVAVLALASVLLLRLRFRREDVDRRRALYAAALVIGVSYTGVAINVQAALWNPIHSTVEQVRRQLPADAKLVSFGAVDHRFAYFYAEEIPQLAWPQRAGDVPEGVEYFCYTGVENSSPPIPHEGPGRTVRAAFAELPCAWERVTAVPLERQRRDTPQLVVVVGRISRPRMAQASR